MTEEKHYPTANGSGVAIFDYDNDGRLDLYFATATLLPLGTARKGPNRLYRNLGDEQVPGRDRERRVWASRGSATGSSSATSTTTAIRTSSSATTARTSSSSTTATARSGTSASRPGSTSPTGPRAGRSSTTTTTATSTSTSPTTAIWKLPEDDQFCGRLEPKRVRLYCSPTDDPPGQASALPQQRRPHLHRRLRPGDPRIDPETEASPSDGRGFGGRHRRPERRRPDRHLRRQRHVPEFPLPQPGRRHVRGRHRDPRARPTTRRARPSRAWESTPRTSTATACPTCS